MPPSRTLTRSGDQEPEVGLDEARPFIPTRVQARYLRRWLDPSSPDTIKGIAELAKVNRRTVYKWLDNPAFCAWFADQVERMFQTLKPRMWKRCLELAMAGSEGHIKLVAQRCGELQVEAQGTGRDGRHGITQVFLNVPRPPRTQLEPAGGPGTIDIGPTVLAGQRSDEEH